MKVPKPTDADKEAFRSLLPDDPRVVVKPMFGNLGAFVNGNMFMGLLGSSIGLKLDEAGRQALSALPGTGPFGPEDRPMRDYVSMPADQAAPWVAKSFEYVAALPPKAKKQKA